MSKLAVTFLFLLMAPTVLFAGELPAPTTLSATFGTTTLPAGSTLTMTLNWQSSALDQDYSVFVHFLDKNGGIAFQDDHEPPDPTTKWNGTVIDSQSIVVPPNTPDGTYPILVGLYKGGTRPPLSGGPGTEKYTEPNVLIVGKVTVDHNAPKPPLDSAKPATLNLSGYVKTFDEEFDKLNVSATGPGTRWIAHTPYFGDFGDAAFTDPGEHSPFSVKDGILTIRASKTDGKWKAGLLSSLDPKGNGFTQQYGYFECRAKFPKGPGTWPAFWLNSAPGVTHPELTGGEIDVVEQYGREPQVLHMTIHSWPGKGSTEKHHAKAAVATVEDMSLDFHTYGVMYDEKEMAWYFDGKELWRQPTPPEVKQPMYVMVNLALGSGWPITDTPNPSDMQVDYIRVYAKTPPAKP